MKIYPFLIACSLLIAPFTISDDAKAHRQFNKVKVTTDNELNVNYRALIKKYSKELKIDRTNKMALLTRAYAKGKINDYEGALKDINSLIKMDSNFNKEAIYFRAWFHTNLKNYSVSNIRDYCKIHKTKEKCNENLHCVFVNNTCKFNIFQNYGIEYINRLLEEIIQNDIKFKEIM